MSERRSSSRKKSFLQGRIFFNNRRASVDCLVRDISDAGAKLEFAESINVPEAMELYIPNREEIHRARVEWRTGNEVGVSFGDVQGSPSIAPELPAADLATRVHRLETEIIALRRLVNELRAEQRKQQGELA
jgi:hypothetical protein